jgi:hypothetical protein
MISPNCAILKTGTKQKDLEVIQKKRVGLGHGQEMGQTAIRREVIILCGWQVGNNMQRLVDSTSSSY